MCGLLGWAGKDPKDFNRFKFNILGIANESRGTHSCGVSTDGELYKGVGTDNKRYTDFIINSYYKSPKEVPVVIGHTRYATGGAHTKENAHPFRFDNDGLFMIGAHNGVIKNIPELCDKYNIKEGNRIDSEVLLDIIAQDNIEVLEEYEGAAALLMYSSKHPNTLWVFKGESKEYMSMNKTTEERPLFYYQENENSMYISSLQDSLTMIVDEEEEKDTSIKKFLTNTLYKIVDGAIEKRYIIDRSGRCQKYYAYNNTNTHNYNHSTTNILNNKSISSNNTASSTTKYSTSQKSYPSSSIISHKTNNIFYEKVIFNNIVTPIYFENLLYKRNGHPVTGIYVFIEETGLVQLTDRISNIDNACKNFSYFDKQAGATLDFGNIKGTSLFYIYKGVMLESFLDYKKCISIIDDEKRDITHREFSFMSKYPVIDIDRLNSEEKIYPTNQRIKKDNLAFTGVIKPIGSFCQYDIKYGELKNITENRDFFLPCQETYKILTAFEDAKWTETNENDDSVFEEGISNDLFSGNVSDNDDIESVISLNKEIINLLEGASIQLSKLNKEVSNSSVVKSFIDFCEDSKNRYSPIADNIKLWEEKIQSNV